MEYKSGEYNFKKDLEKGVIGEEFISNFLRGLGYKLISTCNNNKFDLLMEYKRAPYTYEIKTDTYPINTGNIAIEVESRGRPSGLSVTTADYFVTYFPNLGEIWNIKTSELRELIKNNDIFLKTGGDIGSETKFYLVNKSKFKNSFKLYKL
jgi:hypothetical protein